MFCGGFWLANGGLHLRAEGCTCFVEGSGLQMEGYTLGQRVAHVLWRVLA